MKFIGIVGSLRSGSVNRKLLMAVASMLPADVSFEVAEIGDLPLYNQDSEADFPAAAKELKEKIRTADAVLIATPEFNRSMPAALKNVTEWTSRPHSDNVWAEKSVMVMGASSGHISTALAQYELKKVLLYLNARLMGQPEVMLALAQDKFDASGALTDDSARTFLMKSVALFVEFAARR